jgi:hypothetical protein
VIRKLLGLAESDRCDRCDAEARGDRRHVLVESPAHDHLRRIMWQSILERHRHDIRFLLVDESAKPAVLQFIFGTEVYPQYWEPARG